MGHWSPTRRFVRPFDVVVETVVAKSVVDVVVVDVAPISLVMTTQPLAMK